MFLNKSKSKLIANHEQMKTKKLIFLNSSYAKMGVRGRKTAHALNCVQTLALHSEQLRLAALTSVHMNVRM